MSGLQLQFPELPLEETERVQAYSLPFVSICQMSSATFLGAKSRSIGVSSAASRSSSSRFRKTTRFFSEGLSRLVIAIKCVPDPAPPLAVDADAVKDPNPAIRVALSGSCHSNYSCERSANELVERFIRVRVFDPFGRVTALSSHDAVAVRIALRLLKANIAYA